MKKNVLEIIVGTLFGVIVVGMIKEKFTRSSQEQEIKMSQYYHILNRWLDLRQGNKTLYSFFHDRGYQKVAIYGMKELGQRLYYELKDTNLTLYLIDKAADKIWFEEDIISPKDRIPDSDVLIITASYYFDDIKKELRKKVKCPILSIQDVVDKVQ